jgi:hypothetical protein
MSEDNDGGGAIIVVDLTGPATVDYRHSLAIEYAAQEEEDKAAAEKRSKEYENSSNRDVGGKEDENLQQQQPKPEKLICYCPPPRIVPDDEMCAAKCVGCRYYDYWTKKIVTQDCHCRECKVERPKCIRSYCLTELVSCNFPDELVVEMYRVWNNLYTAKHRDNRWGKIPLMSFHNTSQKTQCYHRWTNHVTRRVRAVVRHGPYTFLSDIHLSCYFFFLLDFVMKTTFTKATIEMEVQKIDDDDDDDQFEYTIRLENGTVVENVPPNVCCCCLLLLFVVCCNKIYTLTHHSFRTWITKTTTSTGIVNEVLRRLLLSTKRPKVWKSMS